MTDKKSHFTAPPLKLSIETRTIGALICMETEGFDLDPDYQRGIVWDEEDRNLFLDSLFSELDLGKVVVIEREDGIFEVLDGKQRISTILAFVRGDISHRGVRFADLSPVDKTYFKHVRIGMASVRSHEVTGAQKLAYFLQVNRRGRPVADEHLCAIEARLSSIK